MSSWGIMKNCKFLNYHFQDELNETSGNIPVARGDDADQIQVQLRDMTLHGELYCLRPLVPNSRVKRCLD